MPGSIDSKSSVTPPNTPGTELVPGVRKELVSYQDADTETRQRIETLMSEIDIQDSNSIIFFGNKAQQQLTTISDQMLEGVRNKDVGPAGSALNEMVVALRGFDVDELNPNRKQGFFSKLFRGTKPIVAFLQKYEEVRSQIDKISDELERHKTNLLTDIAKLDRLYEATLDYFHDLEFYIGAGEEKLRRLDQEIIPALEQKVSATEEMIKAQQLRDLRTSRDDLERRVHDLKLTRQVTMQGLPSIRLVQENDKGLVNKINSTMVNTVPLWRQQLAQGVTIYRSSKAAETVKAASDLTNELLMANAENLKQATAQVRKEMERGVFDIEVVKKANETLIATIEESLQIADEGKRRRAEAEKELHTLEHELRNSLAAASARTSGVSTK
jgi:uncharacterized protein YaaN involved in tellurite resistance